ncbi:hypothetical protein, partial [Bacillus safensis]|uniref:hypothetical protein n=1 Tax=Bacillus safensis TaxID=561879 RepID=UPI0022B79A91
TLENIKIKMNFVFLCAFAFFAVVHSVTIPSPEDVKKYSSCWEYALCEDPSETKEIKGCINTLKPMELQSYFQLLSKNYDFSFNSDDLSGKISEFCSYDDDKQDDVFHKIFDAIYDFLKKSSDEGNAGTLARTGKSLNCEYDIFTKLEKDGKCQKE